jgi:hypothetical protein
VGVTALAYAEAQIAARGTRGGVASSPFPASPLDGAPAVQVTWNDQDTAIFTIHTGAAYSLESVSSSETCVDNLPAVLSAIAGSWRWTR